MIAVRHGHGPVLGYFEEPMRTFANSYAVAYMLDTPCTWRGLEFCPGEDRCPEGCIVAHLIGDGHDTLGHLFGFRPVPPHRGYRRLGEDDLVPVVAAAERARSAVDERRWRSEYEGTTAAEFPPPKPAVEAKLPWNEWLRRTATTVTDERLELARRAEARRRAGIDPKEIP